MPRSYKVPLVRITTETATVCIEAENSRNAIALAAIASAKEDFPWLITTAKLAAGDPQWQAGGE